jgi:hypothetical protein
MNNKRQNQDFLAKLRTPSLSNPANDPVLHEQCLERVETPTLGSNRKSIDE